MAGVAAPARVPAQVVPAPVPAAEDKGMRRLLTSRMNMADKMPDQIFKTAPHTPVHLFQANAIYMITGATYQKQPIMKTDTRKNQWSISFIKSSEIYGWDVIAWVVLDNHYHVMVKSPNQSAGNMPKYISSFHKFTARKWNDEDQTVGRKVWWNYWDTCMRSEQDMLKRLNYIFLNPIKHGHTDKPDEYEHSNYTHFLKEHFLIEDFRLGNEVTDVPEF